LHPLPPLVAGRLLLRAGSRIRLAVSHSFIRIEQGLRRFVGSSPLQGQIVRDPKDPSPKILPRSFQLQMAKKRQENLLDNLFSVVPG
jgi:hypothetical protein